jgi:hypothetical protein
VLELEFDPPVIDPAVIERRIDDKRKFWSGASTMDAKNGPVYKRYLECTAQIKRDMSDDSTRKKLASEALAQRDKEIDAFLRLSHVKEYPSSTIDSIAARKGWPWSRVALEKGCARNGIEITPENIDYEKIFEQYCKKPAGSATFENYKPNLETLSCKDLYEFLLSDGPSIKRTSSCDIWREAAEERAKRYSGKHDGVSSSGSKLCAAAKIIFKDAASKKKYDQFLAYFKRTEILEKAYSLFDSTQQLLSEAAVEGFVDELVRVLEGNRDTAGQVFAAYCKKKGIQFIPPQKPSPDDEKNYRFCPFCETANDISKGSKCRNCGQDLDIKCPKCSQISPSSVHACSKCGFKFGNITQAIENCDYAEQCIAALEFSAAERYLAEADRLWPGNDKSRPVRSQLKSAQTAVGPLVASLKTALEGKRFCEARKLYDEIRISYKEYKDSDIEAKIDGAISRAKEIIDKSRVSSREDALLEGAAHAFEQCADYPEARQILIDNPPAPPTNIRVEPDPATRITSVIWDASPTKGSIYYIVARKAGAAPNRINDGEELGKVSGTSFGDKTAKSGVAYYYCVFAERGGIYSKGLASTTATANLNEIADVEAEPGNKFVKLKWSPLPQGAVAKIYRSASGIEEYIQSSSSTGYTDSPLTNGTAYRYRLALEYSIDGKRQETKGVSLIAEPEKFPEPIAALRVKQASEESFHAQWDSEEKAELFYSEQEPPFKYGVTISSKKLLEFMQPLEIIKRGDGWAQFSYKGERIIYVAAIVKAGVSAIFGKTVRVRKGKSVVIEHVSLANEKLCIRIKKYEGANQYMVLYRHDKYSEDAEDPEAKFKYFTARQLDAAGCLEISPVAQLDYYLTVYAIMKDGDTIDFSSGKEYLFKNSLKETVIYSIKKGFGNKATIKFSSNETTFTLPSIEVMYSVGVLPMHKSSSTPLGSVAGLAVAGAYSVSLKFPGKIPKNVYVKPFLAEDSLDGQFTLQIASGTTNKIN